MPFDSWRLRFSPVYKAFVIGPYALLPQRAQCWTGRSYRSGRGGYDWRRSHPEAGCARGHCPSHRGRRSTVRPHCWGGVVPRRASGRS
ncbi:hypothetical protein CBM2625_U50006 [Cupriavidus taiwanensis]|nr:hypothetical protein CBM2625_U50006 [Cupriavidus taiwanensis]